jgi:hypothetical protein
MVWERRVFVTASRVFLEKRVNAGEGEVKGKVSMVR